MSSVLTHHYLRKDESVDPDLRTSPPQSRETPGGYTSHRLADDGLAHLRLAGDTFFVHDGYFDDVTITTASQSEQYFREEGVAT